MTRLPSCVGSPIDTNLIINVFPISISTSISSPSLNPYKNVGVSKTETSPKFFSVSVYSSNTFGYRV